MIVHQRFTIILLLRWHVHEHVSKDDKSLAICMFCDDMNGIELFPCGKWDQLLCRFGELCDALFLDYVECYKRYIVHDFDKGKR